MREIGKDKTEVIRKHNNYQRYIMILIFMSAMVAGLVVLVLMQPAVTQTYICGKEEHIHSIENGCYELICGMNEGDLEEDGVTPHIHSASCYDMSHTICGMEEHIHDQNCLANDEAEEDEVIEVTEAQTEPETTEAPTEEEITEETLMPEVVEIRDLDLGEIYALDTRTEELSAQQASELAADELAYDIYDDVEDLTYDEDSDIAEDTEKENAVQLTLKFKVPNEAFENGNRIIYCELPEDVSLGKDTTARRYMSEAYEDTPSYEICRYKLDPKSNMLIMEFSEEQIGDGNCTIACKFRFDAIVEMDGPEAEEQTVKQGKASVAVKAPDMKGATIASDDPPSYSITKSIVKDEDEWYNGGYYEYWPGTNNNLRRIKVRIEYDIYNGTGGKDLIVYDKLDQYEENGSKKNLFTFDFNYHSGDNCAKLIRTVDGGTPEVYNYTGGYEWCDFYHINHNGDNKCEFIIKANRFIDPKTNKPYHHVHYKLEYYAFIEESYKNHYVEYGKPGQNYSELRLGTATAKSPGTNKEKYDLTVESDALDHSEISPKSIYRGYTVTQSVSDLDPKTDKVKWDMKVKRGYDEGNYLTGDIQGFVISDDTLKNTDEITVKATPRIVTYKDGSVTEVTNVEDGETKTETYTTSNNDLSIGKFDKEAGTFTFNANATEYLYEFIYYNKADPSRTASSPQTMISQPLLSETAGGRYIAQSNKIEYPIDPARADIVFDDSKADYDWKVTLQGTEGSFIVNGADDSDEVTCNFDAVVGETATDDEHYLIPAGTIDDTFKLTFLDKNGSVVALERGSRGTDASVNKDYYVKWYSDSAVKEANELTDTDAILRGTEVIRGVKIGLNNTENAQKVCDIIMEYKSASDFDTSTSVGTTVRFRNNIGWQRYQENSHWKTKYVEEIKNKKFVVYDSSVNTAESGNVPSESSGASVHNSAETVQVQVNTQSGISPRPSVGWTIAGNVQAVYNNTDNVTFKYTLPSGVTLAADWIKYYQKQENNLVQLPDDSITFDEATSTFTVTPAARTYDSKPAEFRIMMKATIDDLKSAYDSLDANVLANGVPFSLSVVDSLVTTESQDQNIKLSMISKSAVQDGPVVSGGDEAKNNKNYVTYTVDINPNKLTLNNGGKIAIDDYMYYRDTDGYRPVLKWLKVYDVDVSTTKPIPESEYTFTHRNSGLKPSSGDRSDLASVRYGGSSIYLLLNDSTHYRVEYRFHFRVDNQEACKVTSKDNLYNIARLLVNGKEYSSSIYDGSFVFGTNSAEDDSDDIAVIEAVDSENNNKKIENCYFAFLKYDDSTSKWKIMTEASKDGNRITPTGWTDYTEITRGSIPDEIISTYGLSTNANTLLGPTGTDGRTYLPYLADNSKYRVIEIKPNPNYSVNPEKVYALAKDDVNMDSFPYGVFKDRITEIYETRGSGYKNQTGVVIIPNDPRKKRNITVEKEWIDSRSDHYNVDFSLFRSYTTKTTAITRNIDFTFKDTSGNTVGTRQITVPYRSGFYIVIQNSKMFDQNGGFIFNVNGVVVEKGDVADSQKAFSKFNDYTVLNRIDDDETMVYFSWPHTDTSLAAYTGIENHSDGVNGDASVWSDCVTKDMNIVLQAVSYPGTPSATAFKLSSYTTKDYDTFDSLPDEADRIYRKDENGDTLYSVTKIVNEGGVFKEVYLPYKVETEVGDDITVTLGASNNWSHTWRDVPEKDCYGYKYFYYAEELPSGTEGDNSKAELNLKSIYGHDYEIRYYNNGAINSDTITVRNHEKSFVKALPSTGSTGRDFCIGIGLSLVLFAGLTVIASKRSRRVKRP